MKQRGTLIGIGLLAGLAGFLLPIGLLAFAPLPGVSSKALLGINSEPASESPASQQSPTAPTAIRLQVSLHRRQVDLYRGDHKLKSYPIAIGQQGWETPIGTFQVRQKFLNPRWIHPLTNQTIAPDDPTNPLGGYWIGFWTDGRNWVGFHGTPDAASVGNPVSHGCLRMYDQDIAELFPLVRMGTVVTVKP
ncbi:MAG TPA: L,D-transpeptidase [Crinalium sp.]|jgi:lipoprotein-anchoring transpeptidase ErfK/SrfK